MSDRSSGDRVLRNDGGTPDGDVPALAAKACLWDSLCMPDDPQLTSAMVVVADILYRIEPRSCAASMSARRSGASAASIVSPRPSAALATSTHLPLKPTTSWRRCGRRWCL